MKTEFIEVLSRLSDAEVHFILIGGVAAVQHGAARFTQDIDVVYERSPENLERLADCLSSHRPQLRGAPPNLPFLWDAKTLDRGLNFTLQTDLGAIDLLGEITGGGGYDQLLPHSVEMKISGRNVRVLDLPMLIHVKRAAGRPKDFEAIAELEILLEMREADDGADGES
ncbi:nucleotidyl transferase AbiEii/AbiGii toxin family protein [Stratiformator vulcanicus]|uniref:Nucleotidyltransferase n=1 Tax=Stratiformator vulcanicus TaxID=2527980 RepID=A0A517R6Q8_9PLAN|nr:nucleotidyl transferase AbiEii/AbiGii toxin family protein [Stratiformator vulcanicus]QDT39523.1 hypothetical protein Pan189_39310 [Stratiformator vulcanicus]